MKKIIIILFCLPIIFNSCKKDDDSNNTSGSIIGTWELEDYTITNTQGHIDPAVLTEIVEETETQTMSTDPVNLFWVFRDDGTFSQYYYDYDTLWAYQHYDYVKNEDEVSITYGGDELWTITVELLTFNKLNFSYEDYETFDGGGQTIFYRQIGEYQCIKSHLPSITTEPLNKKKPGSSYNPFLNSKEKNSYRIKK